MNNPLILHQENLVLTYDHDHGLKIIQKEMKSNFFALTSWNFYLPEEQTDIGLHCLLDFIHAEQLQTPRICLQWKWEDMTLP